MVYDYLIGHREIRLYYSNRSRTTSLDTAPPGTFSVQERPIGDISAFVPFPDRQNIMFVCTKLRDEYRSRQGVNNCI
jgi:hypothetical protein